MQGIAGPLLPCQQTVVNGFDTICGEYLRTRKKQMEKLLVQGRLVRPEERERVLPVLDGCIVGADVRETLEPDEP